MSRWSLGNRYQLRLLEDPEEMVAVEELQRRVWFSRDTDIVPKDLMLAVVHNGGLLIGAYYTPEGSAELEANQEVETPTDAPPTHLVGFVFGFPGLYPSLDGIRHKHCSHMMGVHPDHRDQGIGFALKRAQWQMVRHQGLDCITWTYDPLLSRNAHLNISLLGTVCDTYIREAYGRMTDGLNMGLPSDRFQVEWWVNTSRVNSRLSHQPRRRLDLAHYLAANTPIVNPTYLGKNYLPYPRQMENSDIVETAMVSDGLLPMILVEIPADFMSLKAENPALALDWRIHTRALFETYFELGYLVTDFIHLPGKNARSFYVLTNGESTL